ncbi:MAG: PEP-CTERM sorting domain-containing protein [Candidatus Acidiferrales bacterium]
MNQLTSLLKQNRNESLLRIFAGMLLVVAFILLPSTARADSTNTYQINGTLASGGTFSGTIEFDYSPSTQLTTLINSNLTVDGVSFTCNGRVNSNNCLVYAPAGPDYFQVQNGADLVILEWTGFNLAGTYPQTLNFFTGYCMSCVTANGYDWVQGGTGKYVTTPENSTLLLMGVGLLGLVLLSRRRSNSQVAA